jgi:hypothetical protein
MTDTAKDDAERERRTGAHLIQTARSLGWQDDGEGAQEFMLRRCREVAFEDCGRDPSTDLRAVRDRMVKHYNEGNTYESGYSTSLGSLLGFIRDINKCLTNKT